MGPRPAQRAAPCGERGCRRRRQARAGRESVGALASSPRTMDEPRGDSPHRVTRQTNNTQQQRGTNTPRARTQHNGTAAARRRYDRRHMGITSARPRITPPLPPPPRLCSGRTTPCPTAITTHNALGSLRPRLGPRPIVATPVLCPTAATATGHAAWTHHKAPSFSFGKKRAQTRKSQSPQKPCYP